MFSIFTILVIVVDREAENVAVMFALLSLGKPFKIFWGIMTCQGYDISHGA